MDGASCGGGGKGVGRGGGVDNKAPSSSFHYNYTATRPWRRSFQAWPWTSTTLPTKTKVPLVLSRSRVCGSRGWQPCVDQPTLQRHGTVHNKADEAEGEGHLHHTERTWVWRGSDELRRRRDEEEEGGGVPRWLQKHTGERCTVDTDQRGPGQTGTFGSMVPQYLKMWGGRSRAA